MGSKCEQRIRVNMMKLWQGRMESYLVRVNGTKLCQSKRNECVLK